MVRDPVPPEYWQGWRSPEGYPEVVAARARNQHDVVWVLGDETRAWRCCSCGLMVRAEDLEGLKPVARSKVFTSDNWQLSVHELRQILWNAKIRPAHPYDEFEEATSPDEIDVETRDFRLTWGHINWENPRLLPSEVGSS